MKNNLLIMNKSVLFIAFLLFVSNGFSQKKNSGFPDAFLGIYKGTLKIDSTKETKKIKMEFHLKKTDSINRYDYILVYDGKPRNYTLVVKDREKGLFEVDENNGIILPAKVLNNTLYSLFEIQGNILNSRFEFSRRHLDFEILFGFTKEKTATGGTSKEVPKVFGYPISTIQKATLRRVKRFY